MTLADGLCEETRILMQNYTEAALAHYELVQRYTQERGKPGEERGKPGRDPFLRRVERALMLREAAWLSWKSHVAAHGCQWPGSKTARQAPTLTSTAQG